MSKQSRERVLKDNEAQAIARAVRISPRKLNLVAGLIRGKDASKALADLTFSKRRIAGTVKKVLQAAIANAENNHQLDVDRLFVAEAHVGKSLQMRRFHARGRGRSASIVKSFSHLTVIVRERDEKKSAETA
jgi:large subunit ribosomal protein L22